MTTTPIRNLALLSDRHSSALVGRTGTVQWLAFPRFDSPSVVSGLLGQAAGTSQRLAGAATSPEPLPAAEHWAVYFGSRVGVSDRPGAPRRVERGVR
jgi:GH15 family glucan-1,4-alpha-glucosidase